MLRTLYTPPPPPAHPSRYLPPSPRPAFRFIINLHLWFHTQDQVQRIKSLIYLTCLNTMSFPSYNLICTTSTVGSMPVCSERSSAISHRDWSKQILAQSSSSPCCAGSNLTGTIPSDFFEPFQDLQAFILSSNQVSLPAPCLLPSPNPPPPSPPLPPPTASPPHMLRHMLNAAPVVQHLLLCFTNRSAFILSCSIDKELHVLASCDADSCEPT